ncbi:MAG: hypothetical protein IJA97_01860 [Clostridia bacterium]|nr:hypothetical protein [Clostridia bacterium]
MVCSFFGHSTVPSSLKDEIKREVLNLIDNYGVNKFYVGNNGGFDFIVQVVLKEVKKLRSGIEYFIVLSRLNEKVLNEDNENSVYPEGFENFIPKFAIVKRNDWMLRSSRFVIAYSKYSFYRSYKWVEKARRRGLIVTNLAEDKSI